MWTARALEGLCIAKTTAILWIVTDEQLINEKSSITIEIKSVLPVKITLLIDWNEYLPMDNNCSFGNHPKSTDWLTESKAKKSDITILVIFVIIGNEGEMRIRLYNNPSNSTDPE